MLTIQIIYARIEKGGRPEPAPRYSSAPQPCSRGGAQDTIQHFASYVKWLLIINKLIPECLIMTIINI